MSQTQKEILEAEIQLREADASADPDTSAILEKLLADDLLMLGPNGEPVTKEFILAAHRPPHKQVFDSVEVANFAFKEVGENVFSSCFVRYLSLGESYVLRFTRVWSKIDGHWQVCAGTISVVEQ